MTGVSRSVLPQAEKGGNKINMASGQQWVLVEMVQAFYEVRTLFSVPQFPGGEKFWAHNKVSSASSTPSSAYQTPAVCEIIKPGEATANFSNPEVIGVSPRGEARSQVGFSATLAPVAWSRKSRCYVSRPRNKEVGFFSQNAYVCPSPRLV